MSAGEQAISSGKPAISSPPIPDEEYLKRLDEESEKVRQRLQSKTLAIKDIALSSLEPPSPTYQAQVTFKGRTYILDPKITGSNNTRFVSQIAANDFSKFIGTIFKYSIPLLEDQYGITITSLNGLRISQKVKQQGEDQGKVYLEYNDRKTKNATIEITDQWKFLEADREVLSPTLRAHEATARKTYITAMEILTTGSQGFKQPTTSTFTVPYELNPLEYALLPEAIKDLYPSKKKEKEQEDEDLLQSQNKLPPSPPSQTKGKGKNDKNKDKKSSNASKPSSSTPRTTQTAIGEVNFIEGAEKESLKDLKSLDASKIPKEELQEANIPEVANTRNVERNDSDNLSENAPDWLKYLFYGRLNKNICRTKEPAIFGYEEAQSILEKLWSKEQKRESLNSEKAFTDKERVFLKRLLILIKAHRKNYPEKDIQTLFGTTISFCGIFSWDNDCSYHPLNFNNDKAQDLIKDIKAHLDQITLV
jgi:hypothetical protein